MATSILLYFGLLCLGGALGSENVTCSGGKEWQDCGTACPLTCENYNTSFGCTEQCVPDCFCPEGMVDNDGECVDPSECSVSCPEGKEWQDCGTACPLTCDNYNTSFGCTEQCVPGCFCPEGMVDNDGECVYPSQCSVPVICPAGKEYQECGSPCAVTCENYGTEIVCSQVCSSGCFCPEGKVEYSGTCIYPDQCPPGNCPEGKEWQDCGTACPLTCDNYNTTIACTLQCVSGCFCPQGMVENDGECVYPSQCFACSGGKEWQDCGTACPLTCDNYNTSFGCTLQCVPGCFCPEGMVDRNGECVDPSQCSTCSGGKEWQDCGTACPITCGNYGTPVVCSQQCVSGCFCPEGKVDQNGVCVEPSSCVICPAGKEYQECGSPCAVTCDNYGTEIICLQVCSSGCFCPEGKVEYSGTCIYPEQCPPDQTSVCSGGKEWQDCGTACPLTCDNYNTTIACTLQCVPGCFCPQGMVDLNGVCVDPSICSKCDCDVMQLCAFDEQNQFTFCRDPIAVPCSPGVTQSCPSQARCLSLETTGNSFCLDSCYLQNGGCSEDQVCYNKKVDNDNCNPKRESCFETKCVDLSDVQGTCPPGWEYSQCGDHCQLSCEDYLIDPIRPCITLCGPPACVCPQGMVVFRDRCVDPLECYALVNGNPPLNPLPLPSDTLLIQLTITGVNIENFNVSEFVGLMKSLLEQLGYGTLNVTAYAVLQKGEELIEVILLFKGVSQDMPGDCLPVLIADNANQLNAQVAAVSAVDAPTVPEDTSEEDGLSDAAIAGIVVALVVICVALVIAVAIAVIIGTTRGKKMIKVPVSEQDTTDALHVQLSSAEEKNELS